MHTRPTIMQNIIERAVIIIKGRAFLQYEFICWPPPLVDDLDLIVGVLDDSGDKDSFCPRTSSSIFDLLLSRLSVDAWRCRFRLKFDTFLVS